MSVMRDRSMKSGLMRLSRAALCVAACFGGAASTNAAPTLPKVVAGQASFSQDGKVFSITNTPGTIINWQSFSVNAGEVTRFIQQNGDSAVLNRITGQDPSRILGALQSNGKVFLINPNGVVFGQGARVDVNGLVASTLDMSDADFLAGKKNFSAGPAAGSVRNEGAITTPSGGKVFLLAPSVENSGVITAPNGEVVLAAGRSVQLVDSGNPDLAVVVSAPEDRAVNLGQVVSQGGRIGIYGALVNQRGVLNADSAVLGRDGRIVLKASRDTVLEQGSVTRALGSASGSTGGEIQLLGERVSLSGNAQVDVSGAARGGTVLVGGDYQGKQQHGRAALPNARQTLFGQDAVIRADATGAGKGSGDGGTVVLWSDGATAASGSISARGAGAGKGGLIETSGRQLDIKGLRVDAGGGKSGGRTGTWLIDPINIVVADGGSAVDTTYISASTLTATNADIILQASNNLSIEQAISTPHSVRAEAGNELTVAAALTSTGGDIDLRANQRITLLAGGSLASPNHIDLRSDKMTLAGAIGGVAGVLPVVSFNTFTNTSGILFRGTEYSWALSLNSSYLGTIGAYEINIGNSAHQGSISIDQPLTMAGNLVIDTSGSININAAVRLTGSDSQFLGTLHRSFGSGAQVSNMGSIEAAKKISLLGADQVQIQGSLVSRDIDISAASGGIQLRHNPNHGTAPTTNLVASGTLRLRSEGELTQEHNANVQASALLIEGNLIQMPGANRADTLAGALTASSGGALRFNYNGNLGIGSVAGVSGLRSTGELYLTGNSLRIDAGIEALMADIDADAITGSGTVKANALFLSSRGGIGASGSPLRTSAGVLDAVNTASGSAPINIVNDRVLVLRDVVQAGSGNDGAISIESTGGLTVAATPEGSQGIKTGSGDISLVTHSPMLIEGKVTTDSGNLTLLADNNGALTIRGSGLVASASGNVRLTGGEVSYPAGSVLVADPDKLAVTRTAPAPIPEPEPAPSLETCLSNPDTAGCGLVIEQATLSCISNPEAAGCSRVLPAVETCRVEPGKLGCDVVMQREEIRLCIVNPTGPGCDTTLPAYDTCEKSPNTYGCVPVIAKREAIAQCIANPDAPGCDSTLPPYETCALSPATFGCAPVIAEHDAITACIATPKAPGCAGTLPKYEVCAAAPNTHGCVPVIAERNAITACIATPTAPGCGETLPPLETCRADAGVYGCAPVIARAEFLACVANPLGAGCAERLPALSFCKATPGAEGCAQVLQLSFDACLVNKNDPSCVGILPTLSQCEANKAMPGCAVVLPTLQQCIGSPTLQGCGVMLPKLEQCAATPNLAGCEVVLPKPDFCSANPGDPTCGVFKPTPTGGGGESKKPVAAVQQNTVNLINTRTPAQEKLPALPVLPAADGRSDGAGAAGGTPSEQSENQSENQSGPAAGSNTGVENEKPASKMYCN